MAILEGCPRLSRRCLWTIYGDTRKLRRALLAWVVSFQNVTLTISADSRAPRFSSDSLAAGLHVIALNRT
jgi:hypothetical protein